MSHKIERIIISGGGTGGHIFPAVAIADAVQNRFPNAEILFIGAKDRMEMERVPKAGYPIKGLPIQGLNRKQPWKNIKVLYHLVQSIFQAKRIIKEFHPDVVVGVGGYASAPTLMAAQELHIPTLIQEQNGFAGKANKLLSRDAKAVCVAYPNMERFFKNTPPIITGNPIRSILENEPLPNKEEALKSFGLQANKPTLVVIGGSLGAKMINESIYNGLEEILDSGIQVLWQTGKHFIEESKEIITRLGEKAKNNVIALPFIERIEAAYAITDLLVSRAGASSISEIELLGIPSILIPYPLAAEDHQTHNAKALSSRNAAVLIPDHEAKEKLVPTLLPLIKDNEKLERMSKAVQTLAVPHSADKIVDILCRILNPQE